ncbi:MAG: glycosyltransferase family 2 protein [Chitinophagaceae bacterium]|nr:glycosyltransferase family 2 protein [Chitinophagaceae bacterium]
MESEKLSVEISIVSPVYMAEAILPELIERLNAALESLFVTYEIVLVDDCSPDNSWSIIQNFCQHDTRIKGIRLSRNFGQHHAITAGLDYVTGKWIVVMDCDLQDRPEEIPNLYKEASDEVMIVFARRKLREDSVQKKFYSQFFYLIFNLLSGLNQDGRIANFGIYNYKVIEVVQSMREPFRAFAPMVKWVGFTSRTIDVVHSQRHSGKSSYSLLKSMDLAINIALTYTDKPLRFAVKFGFVISLLSIIFACYNIVLYWNKQITVIGYTSLIVSIWFLSGLLIMMLGIVGLYVGKTFEASKKRPIYIIEKRTF